MTDPHPPSEDVAYLGAVALLEVLRSGTTTSEHVVSALVERIEALDRDGPALRSVISLEGAALEQAAAMDAERAAGRWRGPLHGVPVLVKDNIDTAGPLGTTAGSLALAGTSPLADAPLVEALRRAGALVLGKTNLSEWANFRGRPSASGWSAVGGQCRNPHALDRSPGGSSAGSGAAVAAGFSPLAVGTETDGSISCPSAACGIVGLKPTVGLVSGAGIVPISPSQDTAGPMGRSVKDVALLLDALATSGSHPPERPRSYLDATTREAAGLRVGVAAGPGFADFHPPTDEAVRPAFEALRAAGVELVDGVTARHADDEDEMAVLYTEFRVALEAYLAERPPGSPRTLDDVMAFNRATPEERLDLFGQDWLARSAVAPGLDDPAFLAARRRNWERTRKDGIDAACSSHDLVAMIAPTMPPAWPIDHIVGDAQIGATWGPAAVAGYPSITVPVGLVEGLPVGVTLWGPAWTEPTLLTLAAALERELGRESPRPAWRDSTLTVA